MEKFKELSLEEMQEVRGGDDYLALGWIDEFNGSFIGKTLNTMHDVADFISGLGDGFIDGFKSTNKYW